MPNTPDFELALERLGVSEADVGQWAGDDMFFKDAKGNLVKCYDDVILIRPVPVSGGNLWKGGDAEPGVWATVIMFSTGARALAQLECYSEPEGFVFEWEETSHLQLYKTTEEKWPN